MIEKISRRALAIARRTSFLAMGGVLLLVAQSLEAVDPKSTTTTPAVKLSRTGICHDASSQYYEKLKEFQPFTSMQECIAAGGRPSRATPLKKSIVPVETSGVPTVVWLAIVGVVGLVILLPFARRWRLRRQNQQVEAQFEETAERRWRGHQLESSTNARKKQD